MKNEHEHASKKGKPVAVAYSGTSRLEKERRMWLAGSSSAKMADMLGNVLRHRSILRVNGEHVMIHEVRLRQCTSHSKIHQPQ